MPGLADLLAGAINVPTGAPPPYLPGRTRMPFDIPLSPQGTAAPSADLLQQVSMRGDNPAPPQLRLPLKADEGWYQGPAYPPLEQRVEDYVKTLPTPPTHPMAPPSLLPTPSTGNMAPPSMPRWLPDSVPGRPIQGEMPRLTPEQLDVIQGKPTRKIEIQPPRRGFDI